VRNCTCQTKTPLAIAPESFEEYPELEKVELRIGAIGAGGQPPPSRRLKKIGMPDILFRISAAISGNGR